MRHVADVEADKQRLSLGRIGFPAHRPMADARHKSSVIERLAMLDGALLRSVLAHIVADDDLYDIVQRVGCFLPPRLVPHRQAEIESAQATLRAKVV